jgi:hypothetical protein
MPTLEQRIERRTNFLLAGNLLLPSWGDPGPEWATGTMNAPAIPLPLTALSAPYYPASQEVMRTEPVARQMESAVCGSCGSRHSPPKRHVTETDLKYLREMNRMRESFQQRQIEAAQRDSEREDAARKWQAAHVGKPIDVSPEDSRRHMYGDSQDDINGERLR